MNETAEQSTITPARDALLDLAKRLTKPEDRETYAELVHWVRSTPPEDELIKVAAFLGFLTLIGNDLPGALATEAAEIRKLVQANSNYHRVLHERLSKLPEEIGKGVDVEKFSNELAEQIRQQLADSGLGELSDFLEALMPDLKATSANLVSLVTPVREKSQEVTRVLDAQLGKLRDVARSMQSSISRLDAEIRQGTTTATFLMYFLVMLVGFICGFAFEKHTSNSLLFDLQNQVQQVQTTVSALTPTPAPPSTQKRKGDH